MSLHAQHDGTQLFIVYANELSILSIPFMASVTVVTRDIFLVLILGLQPQ